MEKDIVSSEGNALFLDSALSADAFGKIKTQKEYGVLATVHADRIVSFEPWIFDGTARRRAGEQAETVCYQGSFSGKTLLSLLNVSKADACNAALLTYTVCARAILEERTLPAVGAGGIIVGAPDADGSTQLLFLPEEQFERASRNHGEAVYASVQGAWVNRTLSGAASTTFTCAAVIYCALSGAVAFPARDSTERTADFFDKNFIPLELLVEGLSADVMSAVHSALSMQADLRVLPGEKRSLAKQQAGIQTQRKNAIQAFFSADIAGALQAVASTEHAATSTNSGASGSTNAGTDGAGVVSDSAGTDSTRTGENSACAGARTLERTTSPSAAPTLAEKRAAWQKRQARLIKRRRFVRRNRTSLIVATCVTVGAILFVTSFVKENQTLATSQGLTSRQTVETLYTAVHHADASTLKEVSSGLSNMLTVVSSFYVTNKERQAVNQQGDTLTPAEWLFFKNTSDFWQYGLTQLYVDGTAADSSFPYPCRKDKPAPLTSENGITLTKGVTAHHTVRYNLIHTDSSEQLFVERCTDAVTVTWSGKRWRVTHVESSSEQEAVKLKPFRADYAAALEATENDILKAVQSLRSRYDWLPTDAEISAGAQAIAEKYNVSAAQAFLTKD